MTIKIGDDNDNILQGTQEGDWLQGNGGKDALDGLGGNDWLYGNDGQDVIFGGAGNDYLSGGEDDDTLYGDDKYATYPSGLPGNDTLVGGGGNDHLEGEQGNDVLRGGSGVDLMWGGDEADVFDFDLVSDSPANARDWVMDFSQTEGDKLDVSGIDAKTTNLFVNDVFTFIGSSDFTGASGQLRFEQHDGFFNVTTVSGDTNGDQVADFEIVCFGFIDFTTADFVL